MPERGNLSNSVMVLNTNKILPTSLPTNNLCLNAIGVHSGSSKKEYIKGHVTDGATSVTIKINNADVTVPVGADGWFEWVKPKDFVALTFKDCFNNKTNIDKLTVFLPKTKPTANDSMYQMFTRLENCRELNVIVDSSLCKDFSNCFAYCRNIPNNSGININTDNAQILYGLHYANTNTTLIDLRKYSFDSVKTTGAYYGIVNILTWCQGLTTLKLGDALSAKNTYANDNAFNQLTALKNIEDCGEIKMSASFPVSNQLTEQSVVNLFNAVQADDITLTFHPTVFAMIEQQLEVEGSPIYEAYWNNEHEFNYAS